MHPRVMGFAKLAVVNDPDEDRSPPEEEGRRAGQKAAADQYGVESPDEPKKKSWLPAAAAAGLAGAGTYALMRRPSFSKNPALRKIQEHASSKGFHRVVDVNQGAPAIEPSWYKRVYQSTLPRINDKGELNTLNKMKLWLHEGSEAIPVASHPKTHAPYIPGRPDGVDIEGYAFDRSVGPLARVRKNPIRGGLDIEGPIETQRALGRMASGGKRFEANLLQRHAPGAHPDSVTNLAPHVPRGRKPAAERAKALQEALREHMASRGIDDYALKPSQGVASGGMFPRSGGDWGKDVARFEKHMADPTHARAYRKVMSEGSANDVADYLRHHGIAEGVAVKDALKDPSRALAQEWRSGALGEYRVHAAGGVVPKDLVMARHSGSTLKTMTSGVDIDALRDFAQKDVIDKLPPAYRKGSYGMDVMPFRKPDGTVEFKVLELNPHTRGSSNTAGGGSGLLDPQIRPGAGWRHYRAMTGRHAEPVAAAGALGAGLGAGVLARKLTPEEDDGADGHVWP